MKLAFTHSSCVQHRRHGKSNETLEFLGDAVLELLVREHLFKKYPKLREGQLSELKKNYTSEDALYAIGKRLSIGNFLTMDKGEELTGGRIRKSNIAGCLEAIIGAIYLDQGITGAKRFVRNKILKRRVIPAKDCKSLLNSWAMRNKVKLTYKIIEEEGPPHCKVFHIALYVSKARKSEGVGPSKKKAEQEAACAFFETVSKESSEK